MVAPGMDDLNRKLISTSFRLNLKAPTNFPQWRFDLQRIVRQHLGAAFLGSECPQAGLAAGMNTRSMGIKSEAEMLAETDLLITAVNLWHSHNATLFDILSASVLMTESQITMVSARYDSDGQAFYRYILSLFDTSRGSEQLKLIDSLKKLTISPSSRAADVDAVCEVIENSYGKIVGNDVSTPDGMIAKVMGLFPADSHYAPYIVALQAHVDTGTIAPWSDFATFRAQIKEACLKADARHGGASHAHIAAPLVGAPRAHAQKPSGGRDAGKVVCAHCNLRKCDGKTCWVFGNASTESESPKFQLLVNGLRKWAKEKNLTQLKADSAFPPKA